MAKDLICKPRLIKILMMSHGALRDTETAVIAAMAMAMAMAIKNDRRLI